MLARVRQEPAPARSPERAALAAAIERRTAAADHLARVAAAKPAAWQRVFDAQRAVDVAEETSRAAKADEPRRLAAIAMGEDPGPAATTPTPAEAAEALDLARRTVRALEERERDAQADLDAAVGAVRNAARSVLKMALTPLAREFVAARERCEIIIAIAASLPVGCYPGDVGLFPPVATGCDEARAWQTAHAALEHDPDAALPGDPPEAPPAAA